MDPTAQGALIGAGGVIAGVALDQLFQWLRDRGTRDHAARATRADRLRALYADVIAAAIACTSPSLGYRFGNENDVAPPAAGAIDAMRARLEVEAEEDGQDVLTAFIGVANGARTLAIDASKKSRSNDAVPQAEIRKDEKVVRDAIEGLQAACRRRLLALR